MSDNTPLDPDVVRDGFDLIEYPCDYAFKALCRVDPQALQTASETVRQLVLAHVAEASLLGVQVKPSRTGKFESITVTVRLAARSELEAIYASVAASPLVVMTL